MHKDFTPPSFDICTREFDALVQILPNTLKDDLLERAKCVEETIVALFPVQEQLNLIQKQARDAAFIAKIKRNFVQRYALKKYINHPPNHDGKVGLFHENYMDDLTFATHIDTLCSQHLTFEHPDFEVYAKYAAWATLTPEGQKRHRSSTLFKHPSPLDFTDLLKDTSCQGMHRDNFSLTDPGLSPHQSLDHTHYCLLCHTLDKDSCAKGFREKPISISSSSQEAPSPPPFKKNPLDIELSGCPLGMKISEMNTLRREGHLIAALAVAMVDNPMLCLTGHRICNDCMKSCIFQKQDPVNVPGVESEILRSVLHLPYGFEIYALLTQWNPLNTNPLPKEPTGKNILVVGSGPAGITLAHCMLHLGHAVVMVEGMRITPLPFDVHAPIKDITSVWEDLDERTPQGFGGVTEYGITVRWDKNNLTLARIFLERHPHFQLFGGVYFGGNLTEEDAIERLGFDHIALCCGAGKPNLLKIQNVDAKGVRYAPDFLMTLQQGGTFLKDGLTNLDLMLPAIVVGGGLTSVDTATEILAYYPRYVQKIAQNFAQNFDESHSSRLSAEEKSRLTTLLSHHALFEKEGMDAQRENRPVDFTEIFKNIGGVTLLYRKDIRMSPAYRLNHEELAHAIQEGISILEHAELHTILVDEEDFVKGIIATVHGRERSIQARSVFLAMGTAPRESEGEVVVVSPTLPTHSRITTYGDMDPLYHGSVVRAIASAKNGAPALDLILCARPKRPPHLSSFPQFITHIKDMLSSKVIAVIHHTQSMYEIVLRSPLAAEGFQPGQFFKVQNLRAPLCEPVAATGARVDKDRGVISVILEGRGTSTHILKNTKPGDAISLMGPTGKASQIPFSKNVLLIGEDVGNAVYFSIGRAALEQGCTVTLLAGFKSAHNLFLYEELEACSSKLIVSYEDGSLPEGNSPRRLGDQSIHGTILDALSTMPDLHSFEHIFMNGSNSMMEAASTFLKQQNVKNCAIASLNSPMQCMMKGVCAKCVQRRSDGTLFFACAEQNQPVDRVDFSFLKNRLGQNKLSEILKYSP